MASLADQCLEEGLAELFAFAGDTAYVTMAAGGKRRLTVLFQEPTSIGGELEPAELTAPAALARASDIADVAAGDSLRIELSGGDRVFEITAFEPDSRGATRIILADSST